jgi:HD-like signal output (HDOD) protein
MPDLAEQIRADIAANRIQLPTPPEVALQVREAVDSEQTDAATLAGLIGRDPALTARLLQVANSPLYRGRVAIESVQMAITRMGLKLVKNLVLSLAMKQMFQATSGMLDKALRDLWSDAVEVAAITRLLSHNVDGLDPEQAMLAGLIHNIGGLPVLARLDHEGDSESDTQTLQPLLVSLAPELGSYMLREWGFAEELARVPEDCVDLAREVPEPDYADLVLVARLQHLATVGRTDAAGDIERWGEYSAFDRIGVFAEVIVMEGEDTSGQIAAVRDMLNG